MKRGGLSATQSCDDVQSSMKSAIASGRSGSPASHTAHSPPDAGARIATTVGVERSPLHRVDQRQSSLAQNYLSGGGSTSVYVHSRERSLSSLDATGGSGGEAVRTSPPRHGEHGRRPSAAEAVAAAAGARAAGAAVPFLYSLKLPSTAVTHLSGGGDTAAEQSCDSLNGSVSSPLGSSALHSRHRVGDTGGPEVTSSPTRAEEIAAVAIRGGGTASPTAQRPPPRRSIEVDGAPAAAAAAAAGPMMASEARARNRLPSGAHIRRRPRSVVRRYPGAVGEDSAASPMTGALDATLSSSYAPVTPHLRSRGSTAVSLGASTSGAAAGRGGTGRAGDVLLPGTRSGGHAAGATAAAPRRRADPSPAPSRPPRSRKPRAGAASSTPAFSPASPALVGLGPTHASSHASSHALHVSKRLQSEQSSPGASSPLNGSLERGSFFLVGERDSLVGSTSAAATAHHQLHRSGRSGRSGGAGAAPPAAANSAKPPSGRRQSSLARVLAPVQPSTSAGHADELKGPQPPHDHAKVLATYLALCAEAGEEPRVDWVAALTQPRKGERAGSLFDCSTTTSSHFLLSAPQQHTPRGGARPRIVSSNAASLSPAGAAVASTNTPNTPAPQRASTPAARRTKSPGSRHGGAGASSPTAAPPKRSGSVGRITAVNRPSIFGSVTQPHASGGGGGGHTPHTSTGTTSTAETPSVADACARTVAAYCAEHLQPLVDATTAVTRRRDAVSLALQSFLNVADATLSATGAAPSAAAPPAAAAAAPTTVASAHVTHHLRYGSSSSGAVHAGTAASSPSTTPRKPSGSRHSTSSSVANTAGAVVAGAAARRAATGASKAASLSDALQALQGAVVALLCTLSDGVNIARGGGGGGGNAGASQERAPAVEGVEAREGAFGVQQSAALTSSTAGVMSCSLFSPDDVISGRVDRTSAAATTTTTSPQLMSPESTASIGLPGHLHIPHTTGSALPLVPQLSLVGAMGGPPGASPPASVGHVLSPLLSAPRAKTTQAEHTAFIGAVSPTAAASAAAVTATATATRPRGGTCVDVQEREVAMQLHQLRLAVRDALGCPVTALEAAVTQAPSMPRDGSTDAAESAAAAAAVRLETSDTLSTPFFVSPRYLIHLAAAVATSAGDAAAVAASPTLGASMQSSTASSSPKAAHKKAKATKLRSISGSGSGGGVTGRSSTSSTPRARTGVAAVPYTPLFTFTVDDDGGGGAGDDNVNGVGSGEEAQQQQQPVRSVSACSAEVEGGGGDSASGAAAAAATGGVYLLQCVRHGTTSGGGACTPRLGVASGRSSGRQPSAMHWVATDLSASVGSMQAGGGAAPTSSTSSKRVAGKSGGGGGGKRSASAGAGKSGRAGGGGLYQSRPALSTSQKLQPSTTTTTTTTTIGASKPLKKSRATPAQLQPQSEHGSHEAKEQQQQQLVKAWTLWTALGQLVADGAGAAAEASASFSPRPSSASAEASAPGAVIVHRSSRAATEEPGAAARDAEDMEDTATPLTGLTAAAPTAAATPAAADAPCSGAFGGAARLGGSATAMESLDSPPPPSGTLPALGSAASAAATAVDDDDDDDDTLHGQFSATRARVAESAASLSSLQGVPRRLNMDDGALLSHRSDGDCVTHVGGLQTSTSAGTLPYSASVVEARHTTAVPSCVLATAAEEEDEETAVDVSAVPTSAARGAVATASQRAAVRRITSWWLGARYRHHAAQQHRRSHLAESAAQRLAVMAARRDGFVLQWVRRWRLRRLVAAQQQQQQRQQPAGDSPTAHRVAALKKDGVATALTATATTAAAAVTSRERFQRAKEQRKAALALAAAPVSGTARPPSTSSPGGARDAAAAAAATPMRVPPLPLATSGISTFAVGDCDEEDRSFTVSAMHRLLNAPPSLLYAVCTAVLRYPTSAPMAYLDNSSSSTAATRGSEARQGSEALPSAMDERCGNVADGGDAVLRWRQSWQTSRDHSPARPRTDGDGDGHAGAAHTAQQRRWIRAGLLHIRHTNLRHFVSGAFRAVLPGGGGGGAPTLSDAASVSATRSYRSGDRSTASTAAPSSLRVPRTTRCDSVVDANELRHATPVVKRFHRPFEQWGMAHNLTARVFCAAAIYAWQLIFSHTPFDDAKQRELPTREEQQARLERVGDRNGLILDCYGVRSEREWLREATKDVSFVGQLLLPPYDREDPEQARESRDNYEFVHSFLLQCFSSVNSLAEIPNYLVGAGLFFLLKEVFHCTTHSPSTRRMLDVLPRLVVAEGCDHIASVAPTVAAPPGPAAAAPFLLVPPRDTAAVPGLSGLQRAVLLRYEQLRQLQHLSNSLLDQGTTTSTTAGGSGGNGSSAAAERATRSKQQQQQQQQRRRRSRSPAASTTSIGGGAKDRAKPAKGSAADDGGSDVAASTSTKTAVVDDDDDATSPLRRCIASTPAGPLTPLRATPVASTLRSSLFASPAVLRDEHLERERSAGATHRRSLASATTASSTSTDNQVQLVRLPHRLLRPSVADAQFMRDVEDEVSKSLRGVLRAWSGNSSGTSLDLFEVRAALTAGADVQDALDIAYPRHFLVRLSEVLALELFGLPVSLSSCEDLDSVGQG